MIPVRADSGSESGGDWPSYRPWTLHVSLCVADLSLSERFLSALFHIDPVYRVERSTVHFSIFGNQVVFHEFADTSVVPLRTGPDDGAPVPHFGIIVDVDTLGVLYERARALGSDVLINLSERRAGTRFHHAFFFVREPGGHAIEIKAYV